MTWEWELGNFNKNDMKNELTMMTPARRLLGAEFPYGEPLRKGSLVELRRLTDEEELVKDRRTLKRGVIGGGLLAGTAVAIIRKGRVGSPAPRRWIRKGLRKNIKRGELLRKKGIITPGEATNLEQKRDKLSQVRDAAIIGGTGAVGVGALVAGREVAKTGKTARRAIDKGSAVIERTAKRVRTEVTPDALVDSAGAAVKRKVKSTTKRMFPTFTKIGKRMVKNFETPAQRMGVIEFAEVAEPRQNRKQVVGRNNQYTDTLAVASGLKKGYDRTGARQHVAIGDSRALRSAWGKAKEVNKWGSRGGRVVKDAADVVTGKPRQRDGSGRKKKREWEKSWAKTAMTNAAIGTGVLGYSVGLKKSRRMRALHQTGVRKATLGGRLLRKALNDFQTPAQAMGVIEFDDKKGDRGSLALKVGIGAGAVGAANGAVMGALSTSGSKDAKDYFKKKRGFDRTKRSDRVLRAGDGRTKESGPFRKGKFTSSEARRRAVHNSGRKLRKTLGRRSLAGGLIGAAVLGGGAAYAARKKKKEFSSPASQILVNFDSIAAEAGWDVRDPRGRSARVFAPGSRKRVRREKKWGEEVENERKLWKGGMVGAGLLAGAAGIAVGRKMRKPVKVPKRKGGGGLGQFIKDGPWKK